MSEVYYHDRQRGLLVYKTTEPATLVRYVPQAVQIADDHVALPATLHNLQICRWLGMPVVPLLNYDYDWPRGQGIDMPFRAQIITANFLAMHPRAFCLSDMRTGKTMSMLWAADRVMREYPAGQCRAIISAPLGILQDVWGNAIFKHFLGRRTCRILHGSAAHRMRELEIPADFYIINHDGVGIGSSLDKKGKVVLGGLSLALAQRTDIKMALLDEVGSYRDGQSRRHRVARQVLVPKPYFWAASGTPLPNGPTDAHAEARLVNGAYGESFKTYKPRVMYQLDHFKWVPKRGAEKEALKLLTPAVRFRIQDCVDVPPMLPPQVISVAMSPTQKKAYDAFKHSALLAVEGGAITAVNEAVLRNKLIQLACGVVYEQRDDKRFVHQFDPAPRIKALYEVMRQAGKKVIIFAPLTSVLTLLERELGKEVVVEGVRRPQFKVGLINGAVTPKKRAEILAAFRDPDGLDALLADPGTLSYGIDLSECSVIVWYCLPEKTEQYLQANERIRGPKQKVPTLVVHLVATDIEREIFRRLESKESLQGAMLALIKGEGNGHNGRRFGAPPPGFEGIS